MIGIAGAEIKFENGFAFPSVLWSLGSKFFLRYALRVFGARIEDSQSASPSSASWFGVEHSRLWKSIRVPQDVRLFLTPLDSLISCSPSSCSSPWLRKRWMLYFLIWDHRTRLLGRGSPTRFRCASFQYKLTHPNQRTIGILILLDIRAFPARMSPHAYLPIYFSFSKA